MVPYAIGWLKGVAGLFLHPLLYVFIGLAFYIGYKRVKRERKEFKVKVHPLIDNLIQSVLPGLLVGIVFSTIVLVAGISIPMGMVVLIGMMYILLGLSLKTRLMNPAYAIGLSALVASLLPAFHTGSKAIDRWIMEVQHTPIETLAFLLAMLLIQEAILILWKGAKRTSPRLFKGKRGQFIGAHEATRLWLVPQFLLLPVGSFPHDGWWPLFSMDAAGYTIILIPFAVGFRQLVTSTMPAEAIKMTGEQVLALGVLVSLITLGGFYFNLPMLSLIAVIGGMLCREFITIAASKYDNKRASFFVKRNAGLLVLGVVPGAPAASMGIEIGEVIMKVNGMPVANEEDFYKALQINAAFCKLEVLDKNGEIRFAQRSLYENEHHKLGLLFVHELEDRKSAVGT
ncbi:PDZ domain-containing protein [Fictibacillus sp. Mic-4]|uniref:PDZ domain-containing protein n=1 Tax=Fictibacillus TaxID=1329200 RepID=UPI00041B2B8F|nr:PDZ domain-containing protein [Fictibacillus gelatini]